MQPFTLTHNGKTYTVEDEGDHYKVTFPEGHSMNLEVHLDESQETAFSFEMELAKVIGEEIIRKTM